ncbi:MAG: nicotinate-nucleotide diphosphorylase (carboxylating) [Omnitrophica bacterium GWA2_52_8]|nr:MAG: nicotinate-nucleotide diphosphorylase (carboxylating) [Omnitrophica bacterium GWA2_52_8]
MKTFSGRTQKLIRLALTEDIGNGDVTARALLPRRPQTATAVVIAKQSGIFCGEPLVRYLCRFVRPRLNVRFFVRDGAAFGRNQKLFLLKGRLTSLLAAERVLLNFLGRLTGITTLTRSFVKLARRRGVAVYDTRKTTPLWRELEKYAVKTGGGCNHRMDLGAQVFVKENHKVFGRLERLKKLSRPYVMEVRSQRELMQVLAYRPSVILFDNFTPGRLKALVGKVRKQNRKIGLEASGGIRLQNLQAYLNTGIDRISVGQLTHSVPSVDLSMLVLKPSRRHR